MFLDFENGLKITFGASNFMKVKALDSCTFKQFNP